ncbi:hypothetical protein MBLNU457_6075t1 [Dothideomycetes sp. NU457]
MAKRMAEEEAGRPPKRKMAIDYLLENSDDETTPQDVAAGSADFSTAPETPSTREDQSQNVNENIDHTSLANILFEAASRAWSELETTEHIEEGAHQPASSPSAGPQVTSSGPVVASNGSHSPADTVQETDASTRRPKIVRLKLPQPRSTTEVSTNTQTQDQVKTEEPDVAQTIKTETKKSAVSKIRWSEEHSDYLRELSNRPLPWEQIYVLFRERYPTPPNPYRSDHAMQVKLNRWQSADRRASAAAAAAPVPVPAGQTWTAVNGDGAGESQGQGQGRGSLSAVRIGSLGGNGGSGPRYRTARNIKEVFKTEPEDASPAPAVERSTANG